MTIRCDTISHLPTDPRVVKTMICVAKNGEDQGTRDLKLLVLSASYHGCYIWQTFWGWELQLTPLRGNSVPLDCCFAQPDGW